MKSKVLSDLFWAGAVALIAVSLIASATVYGITAYINQDQTIEVIHDTITVEVIKEIPIECGLPHVQAKSTPIQKPIEQVVPAVEKAEPKDSTL